MSRSITLYVLGTSSLTASNAAPLKEMRLWCNIDELSDQLIGKDAVVQSHQCPRGFSLDVGTDTLNAISDDENGPLRYTYADEIVKVVLPEAAIALDRASMEYFRSLANDEEGKNLPIVLVYS